MVMGGLSIAAVSFFALAYLHSVFFLWGILAVFSLGIGIVNSYLPSLVSVVVKNQNEGKAMGIYESIGSLGRILGPAIAYLTVFASISQLYWIYGLVLLICAISFLWYKQA